jgi:hypothetical protein
LPQGYQNQSSRLPADRPIYIEYVVICLKSIFEYPQQRRRLIVRSETEDVFTKRARSVTIQPEIMIHVAEDNGCSEIAIRGISRPGKMHDPARSSCAFHAFLRTFSRVTRGGIAKLEVAPWET